MILGKAKNNNDLTIRDRLTRLETKVSILQALGIGTFLGVLTLVAARAFA